MVNDWKIAARLVDRTVAELVLEGRERAVGDRRR